MHSIGNFPPIYRYYKEQEKTKDVVPTVKDSVLGEGISGIVVPHRNLNGFVVKKSEFDDLNNEFRIASILDHPCLTKSHNLFIKIYPNGEEKHKILMERNAGKTILDLIDADEKLILSTEDIIDLVVQLKDCCLYVNSKKVAWVDLDPGNVFIYRSENKMRLKLCDFDLWKQTDDDIERVKKLLIESINVVSSLIDNFFANSDECTLESVIFPSDFFGEQIPTSPVGREIEIENPIWLQNFVEKLNNKSDSDKIELLGAYFDAVINQLKSLAKS